MQNADNIGSELQAFEFLVYPSKSIQMDRIKAGLLTSFGFGQVGGQALIIHPEYLLGSLESAAYQAYRLKNGVRERQSYRKFNDFLTKRALVDVKDGAPYVADVENAMLLNPIARAVKDSTGSYAFVKKPEQLPAAVAVSPETAAAAAAVSRQYASAPGVHGVGTDVELISAVPTSDVFLSRNFTDAELDYCRNAPDFAASLAGKWTAKEAVFKSLKTSSKGGGAAMKEIEIVSGKEGPQVVLTGEAKKVAAAQGISAFELSISVRPLLVSSTLCETDIALPSQHSDQVAMAFAVAKK